MSGSMGHMQRNKLYINIVEVFVLIETKQDKRKVVETI
jgi:hypothetical protein